MSTQKTVVLPFSGFYYSIHDDAMDYALESMFQNEEGTPNQALVMHAWDGCDWQSVRVAYAKEYCEAFGREFEIPSLAFESLQSPREYNFTTDRVFAYIGEDDIRAIYAACDKEKLAEMVTDQFSSRDGFISYYSADVEDWGPVETWDHNQLAVLLALRAWEGSNDWDHYGEHSLMENWLCNCGLENAIAEHTRGVERLHKVADYLRARDERKAKGRGRHGSR